MATTTTVRSRKRKRTDDELRMLNRQGAFIANAHMDRDQKRSAGRKGIEAVIVRELGDVGDLEQRDPAEFARRYDQALKAHMARLNAARSAHAAEARELKMLAARIEAMRPVGLVLVRACPMCNAEAGVGAVPDGYVVEPCLKHWIAANVAGFNAVLDEAQARIAV